MTLPDYIKLAQGTPIVWGEAGATIVGFAVTNNMSLDALANGAGRNGVLADLGASWDQEYEVWIVAETGTAPANGAVVEVYLAPSPTNSVFPGKATGTDAAYSATPSVAANKVQIGVQPLILVATADANAVLIQYAGTWRPPSRYVAPVYINSLGVALRDEATNSNNPSGIILVPKILQQVE